MSLTSVIRLSSEMNGKHRDVESIMFIVDVLIDGHTANMY